MVQSGGFFGLLNPFASVGSIMSSYPKELKIWILKNEKLIVLVIILQIQDLKFLVQNIKKGIWTLKWSGLKLTNKI